MRHSLPGQLFFVPKNVIVSIAIFRVTIQFVDFIFVI